MDYQGGEIDIEGVCFGDLDVQKTLQPILEKIAVDTLKVMLRDSPPQLSYNLDGDTAKIEVATEAYSVGEYMYFTEDLSWAVHNAIDYIAYGGVDDENGWLGAEDKLKVIKMRDDLQKNLDFVNMWLERKEK
jgi:hypothetical protein